jgi:pSer/pThr/pTyr-binding forkhead associated (FHA) protein
LDAAPQIVVGRRPWRTDPDETSTYYIVAPSPRKEISGKHVEFAVVGDELQARDMGSTNGTLVIAPDKPPRLLHEGRAVRLDIGDTLDLGEGFRIVVGART